jgi:hypothetical protein
VYKLLIGEHDVPWGEPAVRILKPQELGWLEKSASKLQDVIGSLKSVPGRTKLWLIAMGAGEAFGANRNGDYFSELTLKKYHPTFVEHGNVHRHHKNKPTDPRYGKVIHSAYNDSMRRVELIVDIDNSQCAGELSKIVAGEDTAVSMACKVPFDVCSICGNRAKTIKEYCTHLSTQMGQILPDGRQVYADNPDPTFFDISFVWRPADRIAYVLEKVAGLGRGPVLLPSAVLALQSGMSDSPLKKRSFHAGKLASTKFAILKKLSEIEKDVENNLQYPGPQADIERRGAVTDDSLELDDRVTEVLKDFPIKGVLAGLARSGISLSPKEFVKLTVGSVPQTDELAGDLQSVLPGIFKRLLRGPGLQDFLEDDSYDFEGVSPSPGLSGLFEKLMEGRSLFKAPATRRIFRITIVMPAKALASSGQAVIKESSDRFGVAQKLARSYALYKVATLLSSKSCSTDPLFQRLCVRQNYPVWGRSD